MGSETPPEDDDEAMRAISEFLEATERPTDTGPPDPDWERRYRRRKNPNEDAIFIYEYIVKYKLDILPFSVATADNRLWSAITCRSLDTLMLKIEEQIFEIRLACATVLLNEIAGFGDFRSEPGESDWEDLGRQQAKSYEAKKSIARSINDFLRNYDVAIRHPENGEPCALYAVANRDGLGRYALESKITKKRTGSHKTIAELLPIELVADVPRKEGFLTRRKDGNE